jgi:pimeloyl-ACP methyl ester carboxylesterase
MASRAIHFDNGRGNRLAAILDEPDGAAPVAFAVFAHCFTCSKNYKAVTHVSRALAEEGVTVLRFDFTGLGDSEGDFADTNFSSTVDDVVAAAKHLERDLEAPAILVGHSLGGAAVLQAAAQIPSARAVVTIATPSSPRHVLRAISSKREQIEVEGEAEVAIAGRTFRIKRQFLEDLEGDSMRRDIAELGRPILIFHSPHDEVVPIDNATDIFVAARHPKSFVSLDHADHLLSDQRDSRWVAGVIAAWAHRYLEGASEEAP